MEIGYKLASEEHGPNELVRFVGLAEEHGFGFALIPDHFHPWINRQGQSSFVCDVCVHQVEPDQAGFMQFYKSEIFSRLKVGRKKAA